MPGVLTRNAEALRFALPSHVCLALVVIAMQLTLGHALTSWSLAVLALGQGAVILTNGLDLSVPWTIGLSGILLAGLVKGSDAALVYALPIALLVGLAVGFVNGARIVRLGVSPIVTTLAVNGIPAATRQTAWSSASWPNRPCLASPATAFFEGAYSQFTILGSAAYQSPASQAERDSP